MSLENKDGLYPLRERVHFTYNSDPDLNNLCQGDILEITEDLRKVLGEVHPYFLNEQYKYFIVLSQSCDLVRRDGKNCKTPYITLAAVRSYSDSLKKLFVKGNYAINQKGFLLMDAKNKTRAYQFVERLYNNTEPEYFFLYKEESFDFNESMIAFLKVSIALKSKEHYDECLHAKKMELSDEFKAKLGWLVGNMYSRVGTKDWGDIIAEETKENMINDDINSICIVGEKDQLKQLEEQYLSQAEVIPDFAEAVEFVSKIHIKSKYEKVIEVFESVIQSTGKSIPQKEKDKLLNALKSRSVLKTLIP